MSARTTTRRTRLGRFAEPLALLVPGFLFYAVLVAGQLSVPRSVNVFVAPSHVESLLFESTT